MPKAKQKICMDGVICGIIGLFVGGILGIAISIVAIILGLRGRNAHKKYSDVAIALGIIGALIGGILFAMLLS